MMTPNKKLTREELLEKKRIAGRARYQKIISDPVLKAIQAEKEEVRYQMKKEKKQVKLVKDMSSSELTVKRQQWSAHSKAHYAKKRDAQSQILNTSAVRTKSGGGCTCSVAICSNTSYSARKAGSKLKFFGFPAQTNVREQWLMKCYRKDKINPNTGRICSSHFTDEDYEDALKAKLMGTQPKKLKKDAVPSLMLIPEKRNKPNVTEEYNRFIEVDGQELEDSTQDVCLLSSSTEGINPLANSQFEMNGHIPLLEDQVVLMGLQLSKWLSEETQVFSRFVASQLQSINNLNVRNELKLEIQKKIWEFLEKDAL